MKWQFKPAVENGVPVQAESVFTFAFNTQTADAIPVLSDAVARALATNIVEAVVPSGAAKSGTRFTVRVSVGADGKLEGVGNVNNLPGALFLAGYRQ